ncbi:TetR/AcrR family transcriptional regulator [Streptomyces sp. NPDC002018]|uniref:TetR/AcrR family transcriptional regulator n=1 Tax=Streptomyces sp. NPDC002018 TaxID=3364629 RepID=UPI0036B64804
MTSDPKTERAPYRSPLRERQAASTRQTLLDAATRLFLEQGYAATSIDAIARAAGVGRSTVFNACGNKAWLLKTAYDRAVVGDDGPEPLADRPAGRELAGMTDARDILTAYVSLITEVMERVSGIHEVVRAAVETDTEARDLWTAIQRQRLAGALRLITYVKNAGGLDHELTRERAADIMWLYNDPGLYHRLVHERGWTPDAYSKWLTRALHRELLQDE